MRALTIHAGDADVAGDVRIEAGETRWALTPAQPWRAGRYRLVARSILEDPMGNQVGRPFEVDNFETVDKGPGAQTVAIPFVVRDLSTEKTTFDNDVASAGRGDNHVEGMATLSVDSTPIPGSDGLRRGTAFARAYRDATVIHLLSSVFHLERLFHGQEYDPTSGHAAEATCGEDAGDAHPAPVAHTRRRRSACDCGPRLSVVPRERRRPRA